MPSEIIFKIYYHLKNKPFSIKELTEKLNNEEINVSKRTVYRYIERLENSLDPSMEQLEIEINSNSAKFYFIRDVKRFDLTINDWILFLNKNSLIRNTILTEDKKGQNDDKIWKIIEKVAPLKAKFLTLSDNLVYPSGFGNYILSNQEIGLIYKFLKHIENVELIKISGYVENAVINLNNYLPLIDESLIPVQLIVHRGSFAFDVYSLISKRRFIIDIEQILDFEYAGINYQTDNLFSKINISTFGFHQPLDDKIYEIVFKFSKTPGIHISKRKWHESQQFEIYNDEVIMKLKCKIDIELLGWIAMWMDDITIVQPEILKKILKEKLENTLAMINNEK